MKYPIWLFFLSLTIVLIRCNTDEELNRFYVVTGSSKPFALGDPVYVNDEIAGFVKAIQAMTDTSPHTLITFDLKPQIELSRPLSIKAKLLDPERGDIAMHILSSESIEKINPGDTLFLTLNQVALARRSAMASDSLTKMSSTIAGRELPEDIVIKKALIYRVQVLVSTHDLHPNAKAFKGIDGIQKYRQNGKFKYYAGAVSSYKQARLIREKIVAFGFQDAFIVPFNNGERISIEEALALEK